MTNRPYLKLILETRLKHWNECLERIPEARSLEVYRGRVQGKIDELEEILRLLVETEEG